MWEFSLKNSLLNHLSLFRFRNLDFTYQPPVLLISLSSQYHIETKLILWDGVFGSSSTVVDDLSLTSRENRSGSLYLSLSGF